MPTATLIVVLCFPIFVCKAFRSSPFTSRQDPSTTTGRAKSRRIASSPLTQSVLSPQASNPLQLLPLAHEGAEIAQYASNFLTLDTNTQMEAELLGDISHVLTDITPLVGAPTLVFRLSILIGRLFAMESDYLPDKLIVKDELFFQLPLLGLSAVLAWRSLIPFLKAVSTKTSKLDDHVFEQLFKPVGVNPIQFRSMVATCIDWVVLDPGSQVVCENEDPLADETVYLYWLYEGDVTGAYEGNLWTHIERHNGKSIDDPSAVGLLSDMKFLYSLDMKQKKKIDSDVEIIKYPMATFRVGQKGATLMRIEADALYELMEHDEHLANSIRQLLLKSLQRKVGLLLRSKSEPKPQMHLMPEVEEPSGLPHELNT